MAERCELLVRTKTLAQKRGLDGSQVNCPIIVTCDGSYCIFASDPLEVGLNDQVSQVDKFYDKLEKHKVIVENGKVV